MKILPNARATAIRQNVYNIVSVAEYQITFNYKIDSANTNGEPFIDLECYAYTDEPGDTGNLGSLEMDDVGVDFIRDGKWHSYTYRVRVPLRTDWLEFFVRQTAGADGVVYYDDVTFCMTAPGNVISLNDDMMFFYSDMKSQSQELTATVETKYYPQYADGNVVFRVYDGQTQVWTSDPVALSDSKATTILPLNVLAKNDTPYCVKRLCMMITKRRQPPAEIFTCMTVRLQLMKTVIL